MRNLIDSSNLDVGGVAGEVIAAVKIERVAHCGVRNVQLSLVILSGASRERSRRTRSPASGVHCGYFDAVIYGRVGDDMCAQ